MKNNRIVAMLTVFLVFILFLAMKPGDNLVLLMRVASITAAVVFIGIILYTRILWRVQPFNKLHNVVDIGGKWSGKIYLDEGKCYDVSAHIVQYLDEIKIKLKTDDVLNDSLVCRMTSTNSGVKLYVVYRTKPNGKVESISQIEYGSFIINCDEDFLDGVFFSSSRESGRLELYRK